MRSFLLASVLAIGLVAAAGLSSAGDMPDPLTARQLEAFENVVDEFTAPAGDLGLDHYATRGERLNQAFVALTGEAINPLFGVAALGVYTYFRTDESYRDYLPVYYQPVVWAPLIAIILLMLFNSTICEAIPFLKVPLNALGDVVNKAGAVAVLPLVIKMFADTAAAPVGHAIAQAGQTAFPAAYAAEGAAASGMLLSLGWLAGAAVGLLIYLAVWLTFNVVDVLILICPFPGIDALLKSFRLSIIGLLAGTNQVSPTLAVIFAAVVVLVSFLLAGWSFRLSVFGWLFSTDIIFFRRKPADSEWVAAFSCAGMAQRHGIPMRTLGRLERHEHELSFSYRPWLVFGRRRVALGKSKDFACGLGLLNPFLVADAHPDAPWLRLPPRYRSQEMLFASAFGLNRTVECGVSGALRSWFASLFGRKITSNA